MKLKLKERAQPVSAAELARSAHSSSDSHEEKEKSDPEIFARLYQDATRTLERKKSCNDRVMEEISRKFSFHPKIPPLKSALKSTGSIKANEKPRLHFASDTSVSEDEETYSTVVTEQTEIQ
jgi:hypothetical protein